MIQSNVVYYNCDCYYSLDVSIGFAESSVRVSEAGSNITVMVVLNGFSDITLDVNVYSIDGTAEGTNV